MKLHRLIENIAHNLRYRATGPHLIRCDALVDLGCGQSYRFLKKFHKLANQCWGLDITVADKRDRNIILKRFDITGSLPFKDATVDIVTCLAVLEHLLDFESTLKECRRILRPGGRIILATPTRFGIRVHDVMRHFRLVRDVEKHEHKDYSMSKQKLTDWVRKAGFDILSAETFEWGLNILLVGIKPGQSNYPGFERSSKESAPSRLH